MPAGTSPRHPAVPPVDWEFGSPTAVGVPMQENQYRQVRLEKLEKLRSMGLDVYPRKAKRTHGTVQVVRDYNHLTAEQLDAEPVSVSVMGRVIAIREMGKSV